MSKIEKGIPFPNKRETHDDLHQLEVGESVFVENCQSTWHCKKYHASVQIARRCNKKFTGEARDGGVRIWRVE